jgi:ribosomal protein S20
MFSKNKLIVAGVLALALLGLGVGGALVFAQGPTTNPPQGKAGLAQLYLQSLASKLGITSDKLQQTMKDANQDALNQAVKNGLITQDQADKLKDRLQNAPPGPMLPGAGKLGPAIQVARQTAVNGAAKALGMKPEDVVSALQGGKTLADLAKEKGVTEDKVKQAMIDAEKAAIDQAIKDGKITKDRGDQLKSKLDPSKIDLSRKPRLPRGRSGKT